MARTPGMRLAQEYIPIVNQAIHSRFHVQRNFAHAMGVCLSTVNNYVNGRPVSTENFIAFSNRLRLDWRAIVENPPIETPVEPPIEPPPLNRRRYWNIDALVQEVRHSCHDKIQSLYRQMKLLDIPHPVDVDNLFVEVNFLEQISSKQPRSIPNPTADDFDHMGLGEVRQERVPGLEIVEKYDRLMVLGKPGSGKTTFLQHLAIQCNQGNFQAKLVPIFISLRDFAKYAKNEGNYRLLNYIISREFCNCDISEQDLTEVLRHGRGLILLDGLDEVPSEDESEVVEQIEQFSRDYFNNKLIVTCRIAACEYRFTRFTDVEVADFNYEQIKSFAQKWFVAVASNIQQKEQTLAAKFIEQLNRPENRQIRELAVTPLLLHITCLTFNVTAEFPSNRARLYKQGLKILLKRWDEARNIRQEQMYRKLALPRIKQLMSQVAAIAFERGDYFFEQCTIQQLIIDYLCTLPDAKTDPEQLHLDSEAILKAIEVQHGLLVERADGIYSFSHLTFQEYFTAREIVKGSEPQALEQLVNHITEKRWREVFLLTAGMLPRADWLLQLMKQQVDRLVAADEKLQQFLMWITQKSLSVKLPHQPSAVRAFYFALVRVLDPAFDRALVSALNPALDLVRDPALDFALVRALVSALDPALDFALVRALVSTLAGAGDGFDDALVSTLNLSAFDRNLDSALNVAVNLAVKSELKQALQELKKQLPTLDSNEERFEQRWQANRQAWTMQLRSVMIEHRNIGHDWHFNDQEKELLKQYFDANNLVLDCLNCCRDVSCTVRKEIEETLLLPIAEIQKRVNCQN